MRGAVSLAAALAIPLTTDAGLPFPERDLIIFLTFCVILGTLVFQGLTLPAVIRAFRIEPDNLDEREDAKARIKAADAALARLEELLEEDWVREDTAWALRLSSKQVRVEIRREFGRRHRAAVAELSAFAARAAGRGTLCDR